MTAWVRIGLTVAVLAVTSHLGRAQTTANGPVASPEAIAPADSLDLMDLATLEQIALERNPTLVQAGAQVRISRGAALQAGLYPNPTVGYFGEQIGEGAAGELQGVFVEQEIVTGGKLQLSRAKYAQQARQAQLQVLAQQYRVIYSVRVAYYEALVNQQRLELERELQANADEAARTLSELENVGQANRADVVQSRLELQRRRTDFQTAETRLRGSREELAAIVGAPELALTQLSGSLDSGSSEALDREAVLQDILACSPEVRFARAEVVRDRIALDRERVEPIPNINLRADTGYNFETEGASTGLEVGLRLPIFDKNQGTILQAQAELGRAQAEVARVELALRQRFARTFTDYETARLSSQNYRSELLPQAAEVKRLYLESFQQRRAAWPQVLDAQRDYYSLYEEYLNTLLEELRAEAALTTYLLDGGLEQPAAPTPEGHRDATPRPR